MVTLVIDRYNGNGTYSASLRSRPGVGYVVTAPAGALRPGQELEAKGEAATKATPASGLCVEYTIAKVGAQKPQKAMARIEYTVERRGKAERKAIEVTADKVEATIARLVRDKDAYNFNTVFESPRTQE